ncbi:MAG: nucleotidyltransferase family protein [Geitlerinemataceae cyanobacterium]
MTIDALQNLKLPIEIPLGELTKLCEDREIAELYLFGSVLRDDFRPDSDIDIMVQFHPDARPRFSTLDRIESELQKLFDRDIDLVTRRGIESSRNYLRRHEILSSARLIYESRSTVST